MILLIDNYDSFVHNLARHFRLLGVETHVVRNDAITVSGVRSLRPDAIVLSPGPGAPSEAGVSMELVAHLYDEFPMLGICLGHQTIAAALGGKINRASRPRHGRASQITHDGQGVFAGLPNPLKVGRYHSLIVASDALSPCLASSAWTEDGIIMALRHRSLPVVGLQFHPESVLTDSGLFLLKNFLEIAGIELGVSTTSLPHTNDRAIWNLLAAGTIGASHD